MSPPTKRHVSDHQARAFLVQIYTRHKTLPHNVKVPGTTLLWFFSAIPMSFLTILVVPDDFQVYLLIGWVFFAVYRVMLGIAKAHLEQSPPPPLE